MTVIEGIGHMEYDEDGQVASLTVVDHNDDADSDDNDIPVVVFQTYQRTRSKAADPDVRYNENKAQHTVLNGLAGKRLRITVEEVA